MSVIAVVAIVAGGAALVALTVGLVRRPGRVADATIVTPKGSTKLDPSGAVRSVQAADLTMPPEDLEAIWTPMHLERLARTYWRFLTRVTLGLIRVDYTPAERFVVFISRPAALLRFHAPEYAMDAQRGIVRWRIESGVLVSRRGGRGKGYLQIDVRRGDDPGDGRSTLHVEVEPGPVYPHEPARVPAHAGLGPRADHARFPALARAPRPGRVEGRALRRDLPGAGALRGRA